jgi:hypothetical protein
MGKLKNTIIDTDNETIVIDLARDRAMVIPDYVYEEAIVTQAELIKLKRKKLEETTDVE